jgi:dTDP-4-amino-4,6-dideoxygalactose transaminase/glycosyltransferase involved in cell wall biosynthesis
MRIGYVLTNFSPLSESFIRREVLALCRAGQRVFVYTNERHTEALVGELSDPHLLIREVPFMSDPAALAKAVFDDGIEHLHGSLMSAAHRAAFTAARALQIPFTFMAYSGLDIFTRRDPELYRTAAADPLCTCIIVEDAFMRDFMSEQYGVAPHKLTIIPNSFDLDLYRLPEARTTHDPLVILTIARFVEKKGLIYLVEAFKQLSARRDNTELWIVGYGPEEGRLRQAAGNHEHIKFLGAKSEAETRRLYVAADIFCLPCVRAASGDADGIPTTILEAMAFELPVISTNLLSTPCYVRDGHDGMLVPQRDASALAAALERLSADAKLRAEMGKAARARVSEVCDLRKNVKRLLQVFIEGRRANWHEKLAALEQQRLSYTPEREQYYTECYIRAVNYFQPRAGKLLDIGCGLGKLKAHMPAHVEYYGCDPLAREGVRDDFPFVTASAESLPFKDDSFDAVVFYAVLIHVFDVDKVLAEAARILKPGGHLYLQECYDDPNPIHMNHFSGASLRQRVSEHFKVISSEPANEYLMMMIAQKIVAAEGQTPTVFEHAEKAAPLPERQASRQLEAQPPPASICITTYNRAELVKACIDSALRQTYANVEVVVVDDGSTDDTRRVLESYGSKIRAVYNERNRGIAYSKNRALMESSPQSRYVGILDSDDYYHPNFIARCVDFLEARPEIGLVYTDDIMVDVAGRELRREPAVEPWDIDNWLRTRNLRGDTWLARRALVMNTKLHDPLTEPDEDYDLFYQLLEFTTFAHLPEFLAFIRQHDGRLTTVNRNKLTRAHAANLVKYGYSPEYAYLRARYNPEWIPAVEEGIALGRKLYEERCRSRPSVAAESVVVEPGNSNGRGRLSVEGGEPVRASFLPFGAPCLGEEEVAEVVDTLRSGWLGTGPKAERFEREFAEQVGVKHAVSLNSCTAGLFLSLVALGIGDGDEVITTPLTFAATVNVIEHVGARPVLADIDPQTLNISPAQVEGAVTPRTRAIIPVHFGGLASEMDALQAIAAKHNLSIIEDAAHAVGTRYQNRNAGAWGRVASFSFYANKNLTTAEGGMITTDDATLADKIRTLSLHGLSRDAWKRFATRRLMKSDIIMPGYKFNMPDLAAAIGIQQLRKQEKFMEIREQHARKYDAAFASLPVRFQPRPSDVEQNRHSLHLYLLILEDGHWRVNRDDIIEALLKENIGAALHYRAIHTHPFYRDKYGYKPDDYPHAYQVGERILSLPLTPGMNDADVQDVIKAVQKIARGYAT